MTPLNILMDLFEGFSKAYGTYKIDGPATPGEKKVGKAATVRKEVTQALWELHTSGIQGLGIIPITELNNVKFGAIDIDKYDLDHKKLIAMINKYKMPLTVCRTKSGGAHCYVFLDDFAPARIVQGKLREMAARLGYGTSEIYPKQVEILAERGDMGQWINMPYFDHRNTTRYALTADAKMMTLEQFVEYAVNHRVTIDQLKKWSDREAQPLKDGPPCLNQLCEEGFPEGTRNNGLFNLGVYCMKSAPDAWEQRLAELNAQFMVPPLSPTEVLGVIKSLKKKDYNYQCNQAPIQSYCNATKCRGCKFGVGTGTGLPSMGTLTKLETDPPTWFIDIEGGGRLELTTEQLQNPRSFQLVCMDALNIVPAIPKKGEWDTLMQKMMENVSVIEVSYDMSPAGQLMEITEKFCSGKIQAKTQDELLLGKPWLSDNRHYFQVSALLAYLERHRFKYESLRWVCKILRKHQGKHDFMVIVNGASRKGFNVWSLPEFVCGPETFPLPPQQETNPFQ